MAKPRIAVRREDKNKWERRAAVTPKAVKKISSMGIETAVEKSNLRAFDGQEYEKAGADIKKDVSESPVVFGVKEMPVEFFRAGGVYAFFSHVHKGQHYNMPMLRRIMELGCTLIDYERVADAAGKRLIFFGRYAGLAGAVETLRALGLRLKYDGFDTPFAKIKQPYEYGGLAAAGKAVEKAGEEIRKNGLPDEISPLVIGVTGYGNVSRGAQEILRLLPLVEVKPAEIHAAAGGGLRGGRNAVVMSVFHEEDTVVPKRKGAKFDLRDFFAHPEKYGPRFAGYLPYLSVLINCVYWEPKYPRLVTKEDIKKLFAEGAPNLRVIGDISADINGSVEITVRHTTPDEPCFVYDPEACEETPGVEGLGPVVMAVDNLPCEFPRESSEEFSAALMPFIERIAKADYSVPFNRLDLPDEIRRAVIVHRGALTPDYKYLHKFLKAKPAGGDAHSCR